MTSPSPDWLVAQACAESGRFPRQLKLPAASCRESSILKVVTIYSNRSLIPQQATGNALAPGFIREHPGRIIFVIRITVSTIDTVKKNLYNDAAMHAVSVLKTHFPRSMNT